MTIYEILNDHNECVSSEYDRQTCLTRALEYYVDLRANGRYPYKEACGILVASEDNNQETTKGVKFDLLSEDYYVEEIDANAA